MSNPSNLNTKMTSKQSQRHYDTHTLYIRSGFLSQAQVDAAFGVFLAELRDFYKDDAHWGPLMNKATFTANVVTNTKGEMFRITFARVSEPAVYYILLGKNPDGSDRFEEYDDPDWTPPTSDRLDVPSSITSWADICDFEDEQEEMHQCPRLTRTYPPIKVLPLMRFSDEQAQKELAWLRAKAKEEGKDDDAINRIEMPRFGYLNVEPAFIEDPQPGEQENILCCRIAPEYITVDMIRDKFAQFSTDSRQHYGKIKGVEQTYSFPTFNIGENVNTTIRQGEKFHTRMVYVTFSPYTKDASFALHMCKKFEVADPKTGKKALLIFSHWRSPSEGNRNTSQGYGRDNQTRGQAHPGSNQRYGNNRRQEGTGYIQRREAQFAERASLPTPSANAWAAKPRTPADAPRIVKIGEGLSTSATSPRASPVTTPVVAPVTVTAPPVIVRALPVNAWASRTPAPTVQTPSQNTNQRPQQNNNQRGGYQQAKPATPVVQSTRSGYKAPTPLAVATPTVAPRTVTAPVVNVTTPVVNATPKPVTNQWAVRSAAAQNKTPSRK
jgi:hypothetical protein